METINILGNTQREQWHSVVHLLRQLGGSLDHEGRSSLCDELDRYIDAMEDANEENSKPQKVYALCYREHVAGENGFTAWVYSTLESAQEEMLKQYHETLEERDYDRERDDFSHEAHVTEYEAFIDDYSDEYRWTIEMREVAE